MVDIVLAMLLSAGLSWLASRWLQVRRPVPQEIRVEIVDHIRRR